MNIENINKLIEHLKSVSDEDFDMTDWIKVRVIPNGMTEDDYFIEGYSHYIRQPDKMHTCGTVGCIAGYAIMLMVKEGVPDETFYYDRAKIDLKSPWDLGAEYLGIDDYQASALFMPNGENVNSHIVRTHHAIAMLEALKKTGKVSWCETCPDVMRPYSSILY